MKSWITFAVGLILGTGTGFVGASYFLSLDELQTAQGTKVTAPAKRTTIRTEVAVAAPSKVLDTKVTALEAKPSAIVAEAVNLDDLPSADQAPITTVKSDTAPSLPSP